MRFIFIIANKFWDRWLNLWNAGGQAWFGLWIFMLTKYIGKIYSQEIIRHEKIHIRQMRETLIILFYIIYVGQLLYYITKYSFKKYKEEYLNPGQKDSWWIKSWAAYLNVVFEKEAYAKEHLIEYLDDRKFCAWRNYNG